MPVSPAPLLTPKQAATLLDDVIYERVYECFDMKRLQDLESELTQHFETLDGPAIEDPEAMAMQMIDAALVRIPADVRRSFVEGNEVSTPAEFARALAACERNDRECARQMDAARAAAATSSKSDRS